MINDALSDAEDRKMQDHPDLAALLRKAYDMKDVLDMEKRKREEEEAAAKKARERELAEVRGKVDDALKDSRDLNVISPQKKVRRVHGNLTTAIEGHD